MKNNYEIIDDDVFIYIDYKNEILVCSISLCDLEKVSSINLKWFLSGGYVVCQPFVSGKRTTLRLHRFIMDTPDDLLCDHKDRNTLNNRRNNLRNVTEEINLRNKSIYKNNKSGTTGVSFNKQTGKWRAYIHIGGGKQKYLGSFNTKEEAKNMTQGR